MPSTTTTRLESLLREVGDSPTASLEDEVHRCLFEFVQSILERKHPRDDEAREAALNLVVRRRTKDDLLKYQHTAVMIVARRPDNLAGYLYKVAVRIVNEALETLNRRRGRVLSTSDSDSHTIAALVETNTPETLMLDDQAEARLCDVLQQVRAKHGGHKYFRMLEELALEKIDQQKLTDEELRRRIDRGEVDPDDLRALPKARKQARSAIDATFHRARLKLRAWLAEFESCS